jgi:GNAT superfamily N-acetyltransferase
MIQWQSHPITLMNAFTVQPLDTPQALQDAVNLLGRNCPGESERYEPDRLEAEVSTIENPIFYRRFFGAYDLNGVLIGAGGVKAADWASDTHILYLMAVEQSERGKGVGSALESARIQWIRDNFSHGRCLVSTRHKKRFERWNFEIVSEINKRHLMILEF